MEGSGVGIVAIVQELRDAGLAVTVMGRRQAAPRQKDSSKPSSLKMPSAETNTNGLMKTATGTQVCDDRYTSSYQIAHCHVKPSSPPEHMPEFPQQRPELSRTEGNFETSSSWMMRQNRGTNHQSIQETRAISPNRGHQRIVSGSLLSSQTSGATETFAQSLRKYPVDAYDKNVSSDFVQRIISYTQAKNFTKSSCHYKNSTVQNKRATDLPKEPTKMTNASKCVQTYTRSQPKSDDAVGETCRRKELAGSLLKTSFSPRQRRSTRLKNYAGYDYLKSRTACVSTSRSRAPEVRYLNEMTRCLRDTLRHLYCDRPQVCPVVQSRYCNHRRERHEDLGRKPSSESNHTETQASMPTASIGVPVMKVCGSPPHMHRRTRNSQLNYCCFCKSRRPCNCPKEYLNSQQYARNTGLNSSDDIMEREPNTSNFQPQETEKDFHIDIDEIVDKWAKEIPVKSDENDDNKARRDNVIKELKTKLNDLRKDGSYAENARNTILECIRSLPMWSPGNRRDYNVFRAQLVKNLMDKISAAHVSSNKKAEIGKWLDDVSLKSEDSYRNKMDKMKVKENFVDKLISLAVDPKLDTALSDEIMEVLKEMPIKLKSDDDISNYAKSLANKIRDLFEIESNKVDNSPTGEVYDREISKWLKKEPNIDSSNFSKTEEFSKLLSEKIQNLLSQNITDSEIEVEILEVIKDWFEKNINDFDFSKKKELRERLMQFLSNKDSTIKSAANDRNSIDESVVFIIGNWLDEITELEHIKNNDDMILNLAKQINDYNDQRMNSSALRNEIINWLDKSLSKQDKPLNSVRQNEIIQALFLKLRHLNDTKKLKQKFADKILSILTEESNLDINSEESKNFANELAKKMLELQEEFTENKINENKMKREVIDCFKQLGINLKSKNAEEIVQMIVPADTSESSSDKSSLESTKDNNNGLTKPNTSVDEQDDHLFDQVMRGETRNKLEKPRELSRSSQMSNIILTPIQKKIFMEKAPQEILDFTKDTTRNTNMFTDSNSLSKAQELASRVGEIMSDPNTSPVSKQDLVQDEIHKYFEKIGIAVNSRSQQKDGEMSNKLQNADIKTSTPVKDFVDSETFFGPRKSSKDNSLSAISKVDSGLNKESRDEQLYRSLLIDKVNDWLQNVSTEISTEEEVTFTESMIDNLATDIIDRQKYLQINPSASGSDEEELEYLKYQVFRWLNKLPNSKQVLPIIKKTIDLYKNVKTIPVPLLVKTKRLNDMSFSKKSDLDTIYDESNVSTSQTSDIMQLQSEISKWLNAIPTNIQTTASKYEPKEITRELAKKIQELQKNYMLNETALDSLIEECLKKETNNSELIKNKMDSLKTILLNKGLIKFCENIEDDMLKQLNDRVVDWLSSKPWYRKNCNSQQHKIVEDLCNKLKDKLEHKQLLSNDIQKNMYFEVLQEHIKRIMKNSQTKHNDSFTIKLANELLEHLSPLLQFQDEYIDYQLKDNLTSKIERWIKKLPLVRQSISENKTIVEDLKQKLLHVIEDLYNQHSIPPENELRKEITKCLKRLPINVSDNQDDEKLQRHVNELLILIKDLHDTNATLTLKKELSAIINDWSHALPFKPGYTSKSYQKEIEKFVQAIKGIHKNYNNIDELENAVFKETVTILNRLPINIKNNKTKNDLIAELLEVLKKNFDDNIGHDRNLDKTKSQYKKPADVLYEFIESWCDRLPIVYNESSDKNTINDIKQNITRRLLYKIGELNLKPDIIQDDFLYEDLLNDEIEEILNSLREKFKIQGDFESLKNDLMDKIREAKHNTQTELEGNIYRQKLRDVTWKTIPFLDSLPDDERKPFELLQDDLADAFINLIYSANNEEIKIELKQKISDKVKKFCNDYLRRFPASPLNYEKLNEDLYEALKKIPVPQNETIKSQVEQIRIRNEIKDWLQNFNGDNNTPSELLQKNKVISMMAKSIYDLEREKNTHPDVDLEIMMKNEIIKWLKKITVKTLNDSQIADKAQDLVNKLKTSKNARKFSMSHMKTGSNVPQDDSYSQVDFSSEKNATSQYIPPPSSLNAADKLLLEKIRQRSQRASILGNDFKDVGVSPIPIDASNQTLLESQRCFPANNPTVPQQSSLHTYEQQNRPLSPHVVVNEYNWNSADNSNLRQSPLIGQPNMQAQYLPIQKSPQSLLQTGIGEPQRSAIPSSPFGMLPPSYITPQPSYTIPCPFLVPQQVPCMSPYVPSPPCISQPSCRSQPSYPHTPCLAQSPCTPQPSCSTRPPCSTPFQSKNSRNNILNPTPNQSNVKEHDKKKLFEMSSSSPAEDNGEISTSKSALDQPQVTHLGSLENHQTVKTDPVHQTAKKRISQGSPDDDSDWTIRIPDDKEYWGTPCPRRRVWKESSLWGKEKADDTGLCKCKDRGQRKNVNSKWPKNGSCKQRATESMQYCTKCCGTYCPHPSYLFFK